VKKVISEEDISETAWKNAYQLTHDIDIKDTPFIALTIALEAELWSSDKKLKNALSKKGFDSFFEL
jgi:predicted nucleic acid-binding protein